MISALRAVAVCLASLCVGACSGSVGAEGPAGPQGPKGDTGATGPMGAMGATGAMGDAGAMGAMGAMGVMGAMGLPGTSGGAGTIVTLAAGSAQCPYGGVSIGIDDGGSVGVCNGAPGPKGDPGDAGPQGVPGMNGTPGQTYSNGDGLALTGNVFSAAFTPAGGDDGSAISVARGDHVHDARYQRKAVSTITVSPVGTPAQNGDALRAAVDGISDNAATKPYLIKVEPGVYDLGTNPYYGKAYVDLEGSGEAVTQIQGTSDNSVINMLAPSEIRELSITHPGGGALPPSALWFTVTADGPTKAWHVTTTANATATESVALWVGGQGAAVIDDCDLTANGNGNGVRADQVTITLAIRNSRITATGITGQQVYGVFANAASVTIENSTVTASGGSLSDGVYLYGGATGVLHQVTTSASSTNGYGAALAVATSPSVTIEGGSYIASFPGAGAIGAGFQLADVTGWTARSVLVQAAAADQTLGVSVSAAGTSTGRFDQGRLVV